MTRQLIDITIKSSHYGDGEQAVWVCEDEGKVYLSGFFGCTANYPDLSSALLDTARRHGFELISYSAPRDQ
jgi:hypothetical protein